MSETFEHITRYLESFDVEFKTIRHEATPTSEDSARARGEDLSIGGKALVLKVGDEFKLFVMSAARKLDSKAIKKHFAVKKTRFATKEELEEFCGLVPGSIPPFGKPILPFSLYLDSSIRDNERIAFNAGSLTQSIVMSVQDYLRCAIIEEKFTFSS